MEVMEDGNLIDKVHILIQRDMEYYTEKQSVLQESICPGVVGGRLDFPLYASFAAIKLVLWWEEEFIAAYRKGSGFILELKDQSDNNLETSGGCGGIVKASDPAKFVSLITKTADELLEHLHVLTQEALDHADLSVLTGTIGAAALLKNCLWCYIQSSQDSKSQQMEQLQTSHKRYKEMAEALAERLLDLHCRLLSLYILQDAESLDWENDRTFFESERGSYVIQMWWLYLQGTREDLWNTVPPKMAQRVFSGMLNESLTILTIRYIQACPSENRSKLLAVDISNLLFCIAQLLPSICESAEEFIGLSLNTQSKILRDVHSKCQELLTCLILRGAPLDILHKVFRKGLETVELFKPRCVGPSPWVVFALPNIFSSYPKGTKLEDLPANTSISLELIVLLAQAQPNWALLLKVLTMRNCFVLKSILNTSIQELNKTSGINESKEKPTSCGGFLCPGDGTCKRIDSSYRFFTPQHYYELVVSVTHVILSTGNQEDLSVILLDAIDKIPNWAQCFDRRHVWNLKHAPWYEAILDLIKPLLPPIIQTVITAVQTGASMYQAMSIILACLSQLWDCVNPAVPKIAALIQDIIPVDVIPLGHSVLLQMLVSALYRELLYKSEENKKEVSFAADAKPLETAPSKSKEDTFIHKNSVCSFDGTVSSTDAIALAIAEALCSIDEDNKHTEQITEFLDQVQQNLELDDIPSNGCKRVEESKLMSEVLVSDLLMTSYGKKSLKTLYHFIAHNKEWLFQNLNISESDHKYIPNKAASAPEHLLHTMFHIGYRPFDQLLTGQWTPDWFKFLHTPMGLSVERVWAQTSLRWEFRDVNSSSLSTQDAHVVATLTSLLKQT